MSFQFPTLLAVAASAANLAPGLIVDNFAGGGGASVGIEQALGRPIDVAINHDAQAIAMHTANHPDTLHYCQSVWAVDPLDVVRAGGPGGRNAGQPVALAWFSPDCKHFSKAKGGKPREKHIRDLAWVAVHWVERLKPFGLHPRVIMLENVEEFRTWGPLLADGMPCPGGKGKTFNHFVNKLRRHGYQVQFRQLKACDYGAPTSRKRLFMIARCDGQPIVWPAASHGDGMPKPYQTAASIIDWSLPCPSIFGRSRPLRDTTLRRIATGLQKFVINADRPFIVPVTNSNWSGSKAYSMDEPLRTITTAKGGEFAIVAAFLAQHNGGPRNTNIAGRRADAPLSTIVGRGSQQQIVTSKLIKLQNNQSAKSVEEPLETILAGGTHYAEMRAFLIKYYGNENGGHGLNGPLGTVTTRDHFGLVTVSIDDVEYAIYDIGMRMLSARELFAAQGFPPDYIINPEINGKAMTKTSSIARCGNSVCPPVPKALVAANLPEITELERKAA